MNLEMMVYMSMKVRSEDVKDVFGRKVMHLRDMIVLFEVFSRLK